MTDKPGNASTVKLACLTIENRLGDPMVLGELEVTEFVEEHGAHYRGKLKQGRKWKEVIVGKLRIMNCGVHLDHHHNIEGGIWCFEEDRAEAQEKLIEAAQERLRGIQSQAQSSLDSLPEPPSATAPRR